MLKQHLLPIYVIFSLALHATPAWSGTEHRGLALDTDLVLGDDESELIGVVTTVVEDSEGFIYLADVGFQYIQKYSATGKFVEGFGETGEGPGELMFPFVMAIDDKDKLYFAGPGGRVAVWQSDGTFIREFRRLHPDGTARSIRVNSHGEIYVAALDILEQTTIDVYGPDGEHRRSFCSSFAGGRDIDTRAEAFYGGGYLDLTANGKIAYTQQTPYEIRLFDQTGEELARTIDDGGAEFLPPPSDPEVTSTTFTVRMTGSSVEISAVGDLLLNCALRTNEDETSDTLLTLYNQALEFQSSTLLPGSHVVVGVDRAERVFIFSREGDAPTVQRVRLRETPARSR